MSENKYMLKEYLPLFDVYVNDESDKILWEIVKEKFKDEYFPIDINKFEKILNNVCVEITGKKIDGVENYIRIDENHYIDVYFWKYKMIPIINADMDAENIINFSKEEIGKINIKHAKRNLCYDSIKIPKGALYGKFKDTHYFVLLDYNQFSRYEKRYWLMLYSSYYDYQWECYFAPNSGLMSIILDYIDDNSLYDEVVDGYIHSDVMNVLKNEKQRGKKKTYKSVHRSYSEQKWFIRNG